MEASIRILEGVMRKGNSVEWDQSLARSTHQVNCRIIHHLQTAPSTILLGLEPSVADLDATLAFVPPTNIKSWVVQISDSITHAWKVRDYCNYRAQTRDRGRQLSSRKKEQDATRYDAGVTRAFHELGTMVMIYQKRTAKMEARWRGPFRLKARDLYHKLHLLQPCPLPTTAWSVQKMASAQTTKSSVPYTQRSSTTSKTTRGTLRSVSSSIAQRLRGAPRSSTIGDSVDLRAVDNIIDVSLLAHGGYNSIWLVKLRAQLEVKCNLPVFLGTAKQLLRREELS